MKANSFLSFLLFCLLPASGLDRAGAAPLSTVFTYQGRLVAGGSPANGLFDLSLTLFDANTSGTAVRAPLLVPAVGVSNGLFTAALVGGKRGKLAQLADEAIVIADSHYGRAEDAHMGICHMLCYAFMEIPKLRANL